MKNQKLNIVFHNPNTSEETADVLIQIAAELAKAKIVDAIHNETDENKPIKSST